MPSTPAWTTVCSPLVVRMILTGSTAVYLVEWPELLATVSVPHSVLRITLSDRDPNPRPRHSRPTLADDVRWVEVESDSERWQAAIAAIKLENLPDTVESEILS